MSQNSNKPNALYWIVAIIALVWNGFGVLNYIGQAYLTDETKAAMTEAQIELIENRPAWATAAFAIAVFAGALGALVMFFRKKLAYFLFVLSLLGVVVQMVSDVFMNGDMVDFGPAEISLTIVIPVFGIFLVWYSKNSISKGWLA